MGQIAREIKGLRGENAELRNCLRTTGSQREANVNTDVDSQMLGNTGIQGNSQAFAIPQHNLPQVQEVRNDCQAVYERHVEQQLAEQLLAEQLQAEQRADPTKQAELLFS